MNVEMNVEYNLTIDSDLADIESKCRCRRCRRCRVQGEPEGGVNTDNHQSPERVRTKTRHDTTQARQLQ